MQEDETEADRERDMAPHNNGKLIDAAFRGAEGRYLAQSGVATLCVLVVLLVLDPLRSKVSIASLGASSFITFAMPHQRASRPRVMIGGYIIGAAIGVLYYALSALPIWEGVAWMGSASHVVFGALAVGTTILLMVVTQSEHPPAAGLALGFVLDGTDTRTVIVVILGIVALAALKTLLKPVLIDLT
jgi:CBS-domain-containing membrane protein